MIIDRFENQHFSMSESEFSILALSEVYELLAAYTKTYTKLITLNTSPSPEFLYTKEIIQRLQQEIQSRTVIPEIESEGFGEEQIPAIA
jgi:hypothetical protein